MIGDVNPRASSDTSYAVLGLLDLFEPATPYQLKQIAQVSIFHFWSIPHTQLYTECARLAEAGLLDERREEGGRRRRIYRLSAAGRKALRAWRADPDTDSVRAPRSRAAEAVLRRRPGHAGRGPARAARAAPSLLPGAPRPDRDGGRDAALARGRDRTRARVRPLLVAPQGGRHNDDPREHRPWRDGYAQLGERAASTTWRPERARSSSCCTASRSSGSVGARRSRRWRRPAFASSRRTCAATTSRRAPRASRPTAPTCWRPTSAT